MFTKLIQTIKDKIAARKAVMVFPRKIGKYNSQVALYLARLSQWAYPGGLCTNQDYKDEGKFLEDMEKKKKQAAAWGFKDFYYVYSEDMKTLAFIIQRGCDVIICFRGTVINSVLNWHTDFRTRFVHMRTFGGVHKGFNTALNSVWGGIKNHISPGKKQRIWMTGHSMGGALALLAGARFVTEHKKSDQHLINGIYGFGSPRVGNKVFESAFKNSYLNDRCFMFAKYNDVITVVPPYIKKFMEYRDVGNIKYFDRKGVLKSKEYLSEFKTLKNFLTGYFSFSKQRLSEFGWKTVVIDWKTFKHYFHKGFSEMKLARSMSMSKKESKHWHCFKRFFTKELPALEPESEAEHQKNNEHADGGRPKLLKMVMNLFIELFVELNPYVVNSHDIAIYINNLERNQNSFIP